MSDKTDSDLPLQEPKEYPYIWAWFEYLRTYEGLEEMAEKEESLAIKFDAPRNAICRKRSVTGSEPWDEVSWRLHSEITSPSLRAEIERNARKYR